MNYFIVIFIIGFLILAHELGHFFAARYAGIQIERFSFGFGPAVWKKRIGPTEYCIGCIPVGGYVLPSASSQDDYFRIPVFKRFIFSLGGPMANLMVAFLLFGIINCLESGFSLSGIFIRPFVQTSGLAYNILVSRPENVSGIIGILQQGGKFIGDDYMRSLQFALILTVNFAVFNLLPLPVLDGGKIFFCLLERINARLKIAYTPAMIIGWLIVMGFMIYATILDALRLVAYS
jgi:regulator of sigma E protease